MKEIRKIIKAYDQWRQLEDPMALATVVKVEESSYRRIGARMLVSASGQYVGGISGGCLEGDALKKAKRAILRQTASKVVYDTLDGDDYQIGVGLGCNGRIEILFAPLDSRTEDNPIELLRRTIEADQPAVLLKVIAAAEVADLGQNQLLFHPDEAIQLVDLTASDLRNDVAAVWDRKRPKVVRFAKGEREVLVEYLRPETRLLIVGNNYDVNAMIGVARELGWQISVLAKKAKILRSISSVVHRIYDYSEVDRIPLDEYTAVVLMTHDYDWDLRMVPHFLNSPPLPYLGMLGPRKRFDKLNEALQAAGLTRDLRDYPHVHAPVGLDIGAESPEEIALAIAAEILCVFRQRDGQKLKLRAGTIHEREFWKV
ncbi:MAG: XdhC family protein [Bacteroidota bacterium]